MIDVGRPRPSSVADLGALVGTGLGPTDWHVLTQPDVDAFAELTGDRQWIHVDPERSAAGPFGATIGHGLLTLALGPAMLEELMAFDGFAHSLNYGYDRVRFPSPRPVGSRVRMRAEVTEVRPSGRGSADVVVRQVFDAEESVKPVCVADLVVRFTEYDEAPSRVRSSVTSQPHPRAQG